MQARQFELSDEDELFLAKIRAEFLNEFSKALNDKSLIDDYVLARESVLKGGKPIGLFDPEVEKVFTNDGELTSNSNITLQHAQRTSADALTKFYGIKNANQLSTRERIIIEAVTANILNQFAKKYKAFLSPGMNDEIAKAERISNRAKLIAPHVLQKIDLTTSRLNMASPGRYGMPDSLAKVMLDVKLAYKNEIDELMKLNHENQDVEKKLKELLDKYLNFGKKNNLDKIQELIQNIAGIVNDETQSPITKHKEIISILEKAYSLEKSTALVLNDPKNEKSLHYQRMLGLILKQIYLNHPEIKPISPDINKIASLDVYGPTFKIESIWSSSTSPTLFADSMKHAWKSVNRPVSTKDDIKPGPGTK